MTNKVNKSFSDKAPELLNWVLFTGEEQVHESFPLDGDDQTSSQHGEESHHDARGQIPAVCHITGGHVRKRSPETAQSTFLQTCPFMFTVNVGMSGRTFHTNNSPQLQSTGPFSMLEWGLLTHLLIWWGHCPHSLPNRPCHRREGPNEPRSDSSCCCCTPAEY